ncbi:MAG: periplasmic heavy metal sensor [Desulfovibrio sp.]|nr:periplasmic heavy metal sensor [Desulfovibrio sp.]
MKKFIAIACLCLFAALASNSAMAAKNDKAQVPDTQDSAAYQKFLSDTAATRQELAGKRAEYQALMRAQNPDPSAAAKLSKEIFALQEQMRAKAPGQGFGPRGGYGNCPGYGGYGAGCGYGAGGGGCGGGYGGRGRGMGL